MHKCESGPELRQRLCDWFDSPLGRSLQALETYRLRAVLPKLYGTVALQLGALGKMDMMDSTAANTRIVLDLLQYDHATTVNGLPESLPFDTRSIDIMLLPHTLDFADDPHQVLREVDRVLAPEGHAVVLGFNPVSMWGIRRLLSRRQGRVPWCGHFLGLPRIKDWLALLEFEVTAGHMLYYRPPIQNESVMDRLYFLDKVGDRWWPLMAGAYVVVAKKRVFGVTPLRWRRRKRPAIGAGLSEPVVRGIRYG
ncbi:MAG: class I SAM-dependent methyltransferase [Acidiferrobacterales bacterium]